MRTDKAGLGHADTRKACQHAEVAGEAKPPWVRQPMTITEEEIGRLLQTAERL
jgi:hypothetical protein